MAGETSETADLSLLDRAKQLQAAGEDSETIRRETGWFVGYDNQWRYEIDDSAATLVEKPAFENHSTEDGGYRTAKLGDIMHHEELYAAYPFLKDVTVILQETETGVDGSAFAEDGQIVLDQRLFTRTSKEYQKYLENRQPEIKRIEQTPEYREYNRFYTDESLQETLSAEEWLAQEEAARNKFFASELGKRYHELMWGKPNVATTELGWSDKAKSVLMHEVQHLIQAHEGFAGGSSDTYWYNRLLKQYRSEAETAREKFLKLRIEAAPELQQAMYDMEDTLNRLDVSTSSIARAYDNAAKYAKSDSQRDILWDYTQAYSKLSDFYKNGRRYAGDMYTNTAGEIEARDVSSRLEMTAEQRRETRPDIDRQRVYFSEKNAGSNSRRNRGTERDSTIRYALTIDGETVSGTVEETNDLVALHNLTEEKLLKVLDLGGFPMPSIAVTKPSLAHDNFGDITVVFGRETIDPQRDSRNKVFSRDAWTPTTPRVEYKLNEKRAEEINRKINSLIRGTDAELFGYLALDESNMTEFLNRNGGDLAQAYRDKDAFKYAYLRDKGIEVTLPTVDKEVSAYGNATIKWVADNLGKSTLNSLEQSNYSNEAVQPYVAQVNELVSDYWQREYNMSPNNEIDLYEAKGILREAARYADRGFPKSLNEREAREVINEHLDESGYNAWIDELFSDVVEKAGLRNNRDMYTSAGRSRSFEALHDDYTLENVVRAMSKADPKGGSWLGLNPSSLAAKLSKEFKSISDMKKAAASLTEVSDDAMSNFTTTAGQMLDEITADMVTREDYGSNFSYWNALDGAREVIGEIADRKLFTEKAIADYMKREYSGFYKYNADIGNKILGLFAYAKQMTQTGYFEAKPRRAVNFSEIKSVLLPDTASERLKNRLDRLHIPYDIYGSTDTERSNAIQRLDGVRFALPETDSTGASLSQEQREFFKDSKVVDDNGNLLITYHGSPNRFFTFDRGRIGKGNDQFGAGFYFATSEEASRSYGDNVHKTYLNITKPIVINRTSDGGDLFEVKITQKQAYEILKRHPLIYDPESSPLGDMFEEYWEVGAKDYMIREAAKNFNSIGLLDSDYIAYRDYPNELHEFEQSVVMGKVPVFSPDTVAGWQGRADEHEKEMNVKFATASGKSDDLCRQKKAK